MMSKALRVMLRGPLVGGCTLTEDYIGILHLLLNDIRRIQIAVHNPDLRILACNLSGLLLTADKSRDLPVGMGMSNGEKAITTNVARCASA